jgi:Family of unknown function (DUF6356)
MELLTMIVSRPTLQVHSAIDLLSFANLTGGNLSMQRVSFTEHPASVGETYGEHFRSACRFAAGMIAGGFACFVHAICPFMFVTTGSSTVRRLHELMITSRTRMAGKSKEMDTRPGAGGSP